MTRKSKHLTAISLYAGAGGMDYGFTAAGFETRVSLEFDHDCCETLRKNVANTILENDIHRTESAEIGEIAGLRKGGLSLLYGGPPCQPFSKSGYWSRGFSLRLEDPRASTLHQYMRCVRDLLPAVFVLENVHGIAYSGKEEGFALLQAMTHEINTRAGTNYVLSWAVLNSADYGVPQIRQRFFLVGHREGKKFRFPEPTHRDLLSNEELFGSRKRPYVAVWFALREVRSKKSEDLKVRGRWADLLPSIPEGENYLWHTDRKGGLPLFGWRTRYWSFLLKLAKNRPSWTIQAQPGPAIGPFHWQNRLLSVREMAAIQTFPKTTRFCGSRVSVQRQIGNAVPSLLAEVLGRELRRQYFDEPSRNMRLAVEARGRIPRPEPVQPVPAKFRHLIGNHEPHPGTGKGRAYANGGLGQLNLPAIETPVC
jgi:DNA (cytosine-5)-methyltransferase 1